MTQLGSISDGRLNSLVGYGRIIFLYFLSRCSGRKVIKNHRHHDAGSLDAGFSVTDFGIHCYVIIPFHKKYYNMLLL